MVAGRRAFLAGAMGMLALPRPARAGSELGRATSVSGPARLVHAGDAVALAPGASLHEGDRVTTGQAALAELLLHRDTRLNLGPDAEITLDRWLAEIGGVLRIGGPMVFDRPDTLPGLDVTVVTAFGEIGVRGTRFFAGPSNGVFAVFVQRGAVVVRAGGVTRSLGPGDGVNLAEGAAPSEVVQWGAPRITAAFASVGLTP